MHATRQIAGSNAAADADRRRRAILRLSAAAALETYADYRPVQAWELAGQLTDDIQLQLQHAATNPISDQARAEIREILLSHLRFQAPRPYPLFAEPQAPCR